MSGAAPPKVKKIQDITEETKVKRIQDLSQETKNKLYEAGDDPDKILDVLTEKKLPITVGDVLDWYHTEGKFIESQHAESKDEHHPETQSHAKETLLDKIFHGHRAEGMHIDMLTEEMKATPEFQKKRDEIANDEKWKKKRADIVKEYQKSFKKTFDPNDEKCKEFMDKRLDKLAEHKFRNDRDTQNLAKKLDLEEVLRADRKSFAEDHIGKQFIERSQQMAEARTKRLKKKLDNLDKLEKKWGPMPAEEYERRRAKYQGKIDKIYAQERKNHLKAFANMFEDKTLQYVGRGGEENSELVGIVKEMKQSKLERRARKSRERTEKALSKLKAKEKANREKNEKKKIVITPTVSTLKKPTPQMPTTPAAQMPHVGPRVSQARSDSRKIAAQHALQRKIAQQKKKQYDAAILYLQQRARATQVAQASQRAYTAPPQPALPPRPQGNIVSTASNLINIARDIINKIKLIAKIVEIISDIITFFASPPGWFVLGGILVVFIVLFVAILIGGGSQDNSASNTQEIPNFSMDITGDTSVPNNTDIHYTINPTYSGADDIQVFVQLDPKTATYVKANPQPTVSPNLLTWDLNKTSGPFDITIHPLLNDNSITTTAVAIDTKQAPQSTQNTGNGGNTTSINAYKTTRSIITSVGSTQSATTTQNIAPTTNTCKGINGNTKGYDLTLSQGQNLGDPNCTYLVNDAYKTADLAALVKTTDPKNEYIWFNVIAPGESSYNPNAVQDPSVAVDPAGAWGLFQMGRGKNGIYDHGDVYWKDQFNNAYQYNVKLNSQSGACHRLTCKNLTWCYWATAQSYWCQRL